MNGNNGNGGFKIGGNDNGRGPRSKRSLADDAAYVGVTALLTATLFVFGDYLEAWVKVRKIEKSNPNPPTTNQPA